MVCSRGAASPDAHTQRRLFASSAGYCQNPGCANELFLDAAGEAPEEALEELTEERVAGVGSDERHHERRDERAGLGDDPLLGAELRGVEAVVGHSMGCQVALALARRAPQRVASATLIGPTTGSEGQRLARYAVGLALDAVFESPRYNLTLLRMWSQMRLRRYFATVPFMLRDRPIALASQVRCPALVVRGQRDCIVPARAVRRLVAALPEGRWVEVPAVAHAVQFDRPEQFGDLLLPFVARIEGERRDELSDAGRR